MMEKENSNRTRIIGVRLTPGEFKIIEDRWKATTCPKLSDYVRQVLYQRPVIKTYRDRSLDDFMAEMMLLRTELNRLGNNFNQAVKKLHTANIDADYKNWLRAFEVEKHTLHNKVEQINRNIEKFAGRWLQ